MTKGRQEDDRCVGWTPQVWQTRLHMAFLIANIQVGPNLGLFRASKWVSWIPRTDGVSRATSLLLALVL